MEGETTGDRTMIVRQLWFFGRKVVRLACILLVAGLPGTTPAVLAEEAAADETASSWGLGQVISEGTTMEGIRVPSGSTLMADSLLETGDEPAIIHLQGGQVLRLASHSSAYFAPADAGVRVHVHSGEATVRATVRGDETEVRTLGEDMFAVLSRDGRGRVGYQTAGLASAGVDSDPPQVGTGVEIGAPAISGAEKACLPDEPYPLLDALIRPEPDVRVAKVYFRAAQHPSFYAVEMTVGLDDFEAILPAPAPETEQIVYYVEAVSRSLESSRTEEYTADVPCEDRGGARFEGKKPGIVLLPTAPGSPLVPPGFLPWGILGAGGGLGAGAIAGIVAGGVAGGILVFNELDDEPPASPVTP